MTAKLGRPRRSKDAATVRITIRLTPAELAKIERAANGTPIGEWIRDAALDAAASIQGVKK